MGGYSAILGFPGGCHFSLYQALWLWPFAVGQSRENGGPEGRGIVERKASLRSIS